MTWRRWNVIKLGAEITSAVFFFSFFFFSQSTNELPASTAGRSSTFSVACYCTRAAAEA